MAIEIDGKICIHRSGDCESVAPGVSQCACGQVFIFVHKNGCGRYKKIQDVTDEDIKNFSPEMEQEFLKFMGKT